MHTQSDGRLGSLLVSEKKIREKELDAALKRKEQVDEALKLQGLRRVSALRRPLSSSYDPVNVMEILVEENVDEIIGEKGGVPATSAVQMLLQSLLTDLRPVTSAT